MTTEDVLYRRLYTQRLLGEPFERPEEVVGWLVGVQSQDYPGASWSLAQRVGGCTEADVRRAFDEGRILRTHLLRPTWHLVTPDDIRMLLMLTAPRVKVLNAHMNRKLELDDAILARTKAIIARALEGGRQLTRKEINVLLEAEGISAQGQRLAYIVMDAELDGLICSGAIRGKQHTYALLDERAPNGRTLPYDEALTELTRRFFTSHGPATQNDFVRWSGLTVAVVKQGLDMVASQLERIEVDGQELWLSPDGADTPTGRPDTTLAFLLPEFDECFLTYPTLNFPNTRGDIDDLNWIGVFDRPIVIDARRVGAWKRKLASKAVTIDVRLFSQVAPNEAAVLDTAVERYGRYIGLPTTLRGGHE